MLPLLQHTADDLQAGCLGQATELVQRVVGRRVTMGKNNPDQDGSFWTPGTLDVITPEKTQGGAGAAEGREAGAACLKGAICLRRHVHLTPSHIGGHRTELEDLVLGDGHEIT